MVMKGFNYWQKIGAKSKVGRKVLDNEE